MKEKTKKYLVMLAYRTTFSIGIFIILFIIGLFASGFIEKLSPVWTKSINIRKAGGFFLNFLKEISPF